MTARRHKVLVRCEVCGIDFLIAPCHIENGRYKCCSRECKDNKRKTSIECVCDYCGKVYPQIPSNFTKSRKHYCSRLCHDLDLKPIERKCHYCGGLFRGKNQAKFCSQECARDERKEQTRNKQIVQLCQICGKEFPTTQERINDGRGKYCSRVCQHKSLVVNRPILVCKNCGIQFQNLSGKTQKYCSHQCAALGMSFYNGKRRNSRGSNWIFQRALARERDGGVCQICGHKPPKNKPKNSVHHIKPFRYFNGDYEAANDLSNLITLCPQCHPKVERGKIPVPVHLF